MAEFDSISTADALRAAAEAESAFKEWASASIAQRGLVLSKVAELLENRKSALSDTITDEMGKPITEAEAEIDKCAFGSRYFAEHAEEYLSDLDMPSDSSRSSVVFDPLGVILGIMPWNFPFWQVFRFGVPALMAGNVMLLKHAPSTPRCAIEIEKLFRDAGLPDGGFRNLFVEIESVEPLIADPNVKAVTLTGSDRAGAAVSSIAGKNLKKSVMELGGSDPFIVLSDADLNGAVGAGIRSRFQNAGQSCIAAKRFIVEASIFDKFLEGFVEAASKLIVGDPGDRKTQLGPLARSDLRGNLARQVDESRQMGAKVELGGSSMRGPGFFYETTVLSHASPDMSVAREETFGPVAAFFKAESPEHAVELANATVYGLGANIWTSDLGVARRMAREISTGGVFINGLTHSDPRIPFGGVKRSGWGRELSVFGIREFVNVKTVWVGEQ